MSRHASLSTALFAALRVPGRLREAALDEWRAVTTGRDVGGTAA